MEIIKIIENPLVERYYKDLLKYFEQHKMENEAKALIELIDFRFHANRTHTDKE